MASASSTVFPFSHSVARLLDANIVLEIEDAGDDHDKAFLMGAVLIRLTEHLRLQHRRDSNGRRPVRLRHLTVVEEAHRLLRQPPPPERVLANGAEVAADAIIAMADGNDSASGFSAARKEP